MSSISEKYKIYGLYSSRKPDIIKYIGLSVNVKRRLFEHVIDVKRILKGKNLFTKLSKKQQWIADELSLGYSISAIDLFETDNENELYEAEKNFIRLFKSFGCNLTNGTLGGEATGDKKRKMFYFFDYNTGELLGSYKGVATFVRDKDVNKYGCISLSAIYQILNKKKINGNKNKLHHKGIWFSYENKFNPLYKKKCKRDPFKETAIVASNKIEKAKPQFEVTIKKTNGIFEFNNIHECSLFLGKAKNTLFHAMAHPKDFFRKYSIRRINQENILSWRKLKIINDANK